MSSKRFRKDRIRKGAARLTLFVGVGAAAMITAAPSYAAPLWPGGPTIPRLPVATPVLPAVPGLSNTTQLWPNGPSVGPSAAAPRWPGGPAVPGVSVAGPSLPISAPCTTPGTRACLQLGSNLGWLMDKGRVVFGPTPISHGRPGYETPPGLFHVASKDWYHWSTMHNAEMRYAVFFNGDIATHIGPINEKSHGCIRMTPDGARAFYDYLRPGDQFEVVR